MNKKMEFILESKYAPEFVYGNILTIPFIGPVGYVADALMPGRRYTYKKAVHIDLENGIVKYRQPTVRNKGELFLGGSMRPTRTELATRV